MDLVTEGEPVPEPHSVLRQDADAPARLTAHTELADGVERLDNVPSGNVGTEWNATRAPVRSP